MRIKARLGLLCLLAACSGQENVEEALTDADAAAFQDVPGKNDDSNHAPRLHKVGNKEAQIGKELSIQLVAEDDDGDPLTFSVYGDMPPEAKFFKPEGRFSWTPAKPGGPFFVTFVVSDMHDFDSETVELRAVTSTTAHAPQLVEIGDQFLKVKEIYELRLQATDEDGDLLYFSVQGSVPAGATFDAQNALFRWTPGPSDAGSVVRVTFLVSDGALSDSMEVRLVVEGGSLDNHPPQIDPIGAVEAFEGALLKIQVVAQDPDGDKLTYSTQGTLPPGAAFDPSSHVFTWTPGPSFTGKSQAVVFSVTDGHYTVNETADILVKVKGSGCSDDTFEPNNEPESAKQISEGMFHDLSICDTQLSPIDEDWFKVLLAGGDGIEATITFAHSLGVLDMALYADGSWSKPVFYSPGVGDVEKVAYAAPSAGTYYLRVVGTGAGKYASPYDLEVVKTKEPGCSADSKEPNDKVSQAVALGEPFTSGTPLTGLTICPNDIDIFRVDVECGTSLIATIDFDEKKGDLDLYLFDAVGDVTLDQSITQSGMETVALDASPAATKVHVVVAGYPQESTSNSYSLEVLKDDAGGCTADAHEPNDTQSAAEDFSASGKLTGLTICCDKDWFAFPSGPGEVTVQVAPSGSGSLSGSFVLSTAPNSPTGLNCNAGTCTGTHDLPATGKLFLVLDGTYGTTYSLDAKITTGGASDSCKGHCDGSGGSCWCDQYCAEYLDCCPDICQMCGYCE